MGLIIFGEAIAPIGADEFLIYCPSCENQSCADILVTSHYFHFFMVPFCPSYKAADVICKTCGLKRYGISFNQKLVSNYKNIINEYRHPWSTYIGVAVVVLIIISIVLVNAFDQAT